MKNTYSPLVLAILAAILALLVGACNDGQSLIDTSHISPDGGSGSASPNPGSVENTESGLLQFQLKILELTNAYRAQNGVAPLSWNAQLYQSAQSYSQAMATQGFFSHTAPDGSGPSDRISAAGYDWYTWGENIAYGYSTPEATMNGWINSAGHRANILNASFKELGVGYSVSSGGTAYWVQDFGAQ